MSMRFIIRFSSESFYTYNIYLGINIGGIELMRDARHILRTLERADMEIRPKKVQITTSLLPVPLLLPKIVMLRRDVAGVTISWPIGAITAEIRSATEGCLLAFLELATASDEQVVNFAKAWGVLALENVQQRYEVEEQFLHDALPVTVSTNDIHANMLRQSAGFKEHFGENLTQGVNTGNQGSSEKQKLWEEWPVVWDCEPVDVYRRFALQARALLQIAAKLSSEHVAGLELWQQAIRPDAPAEFHWPTTKGFRKDCQPEHDLAIQRHLLARLVTIWIEKGSLHPQFTWEGSNSPQVVFNVGLRREGDDHAHILKLWHSEQALFRAEKLDKLPRAMPLFNLLTLQLLALLTSRNGLHACDGERCTNVFTPEGRKARHNCNSYCSDKCRQNADRKRSREFQRKKRATEP